MTTKEKILETARQLLNQSGIDLITTRHIAAAMDISHGNLCYHYPRKELIIEHVILRVGQKAGYGYSSGRGRGKLKSAVPLFIDPNYIYPAASLSFHLAPHGGDYA